MMVAMGDGQGGHALIGLDNLDLRRARRLPAGGQPTPDGLAAQTMLAGERGDIDLGPDRDHDIFRGRGA